MSEADCDRKRRVKSLPVVSGVDCCARRPFARLLTASLLRLATRTTLHEKLGRKKKKLEKGTKLNKSNSNTNNNDNNESNTRENNEKCKKMMKMELERWKGGTGGSQRGRGEGKREIEV
ncbi:hypothetical protein E2C01_014403 [Portunus trituberculatus]|uniref:Uncharacterized protein n=1 Tax=Portunus trituberculatus TaxID=210409 RepID=A0A5B7DJ45_PORTR|nr:hypothetical protein [Portunus trituberculatus]